MSEIRKNLIVSRLMGGKVAGSSCFVFPEMRVLKVMDCVLIEFLRLIGTQAG